LVKAAYSDLFKLHGDDAWALDSGKLITYFRQTDQSSELVGTRQASTFRALVAYAGHAETASPNARATTKAASNEKPKVKSSPKPIAKDSHNSNGLSQNVSDTGQERNFGLTVRIEINLPASGDQDTYDKIFKSIRSNLINA
jgi:hypothetical protein